MTAINDIFQLKLFSGSPITTRTMQNVFWYKLIDWGGGTPGAPVSLQLSESFETLMGAAIRDVMVVGSNLSRTEVVDYGDPTDFLVCTTACGWPLTGARAGQPLPAYVCFSFRYDRPFPGQRSGWKRYSALSESDVDGDAAAIGMIPLLDIIRAGMETTLIGGFGAQFKPVVPTGLKVLGINPTVWESVGVTYAGVGSQVSRKPPLSP